MKIRLKKRDRQMAGILSNEGSPFFDPHPNFRPSSVCICLSQFYKSGRLADLSSIWSCYLRCAVAVPCETSRTHQTAMGDSWDVDFILSEPRDEFGAGDDDELGPGRVRTLMGHMESNAAVRSQVFRDLASSLIGEVERSTASNADDGEDDLPDFEAGFKPQVEQILSDIAKKGAILNTFFEDLAKRIHCFFFELSLPLCATVAREISDVGA